MKMGYVLGAAIIVAAGVGFAVGGMNSGDTPAAEVTPEQPPANPAPGSAKNAQPGQARSLTGKVLEKLDVPQYTYLRLKQAEGDAWTAVPTAKVEVGEEVTVANVTMMKDFKSSTLDRTFEVIYFGTLGSGQAQAGKPPGHPGGGQAPGDLNMQMNPHGKTTSTEKVNLDKPVELAKGKNAKRVADIYAEAAKLDGKTVRVRGIVVKAMPNIMNKTFMHVQDGTGEKDKGTHDLVVTSTGDVPTAKGPITFEGTVKQNVDLGLGYKYKVLVEDAKVIAEK